MSKIPTIKISARGTIILAGASIGKKDDVTLVHGEEALVPEPYGRHLISDRFADEVTAGKSAKADGQSAADKQKMADEAAAAKALAESAKAMVDAESAVAAAKADLAAIGDDLVAKAAAEQALAEASAALDALKA